MNISDAHVVYLQHGLLFMLRATGRGKPQDTNIEDIVHAFFVPIRYRQKCLLRGFKLMLFDS